MWVRKATKWLNLRICANLSMSDRKKIKAKAGEVQKVLEKRQEEMEIKQWKESDDETLTLPNWK